MPAVIFVLAAAVFAQGTSEFMLSGLLEQIAAECAVPIGTAGLLTSVYAVGMVIGAPTMAMIAGVVARRTALIGFLGLFCASHIAAAFTTRFGFLLCTRLVAAIANAGFLAVALATLPALVPAAAVRRATAIILSGITIACIVGVPAGTVLGQALGWHSVFWAIAALTAFAPAALWVTTSRTALDGARTPADSGAVRREWRALADRRLQIVLVLGVLVNAATFAAFTYLGTVTATLTARTSGWIPVVLALFGFGSFVGVTAAGRRTGKGAGSHVLPAAIGVLAVIWLVAGFAERTLPGLVISAPVTGAAAFGVGSTLITMIVQRAASTAPRVCGAIATTAFNVGAVLGPAIAGLPVGDSGQAHRALWISSGFTAIAAVAALPAVRRPDPRQGAESARA